MYQNSKISIIIPVKNGGATIDACLKSIFNQTLISYTEVIVIDSGSTDNTLDIVKKYPVRLYQIPPEEFGHGSTRNYGVSLAKGEFVVMTVQDARPAANNWLELMTTHFQDQEIAGVCGIQIVPHHKDKNPHQWFRPQSEFGYSTVQFKNKQEFNNLSPQKKKSVCGWDDVNAMYRKKVLLKIPFREVVFGEDMIWAKEALLNGYKLVYDSRAQVEHYHEYNADFIYRRTLIVWLFTYKTFGYLRPKPYKATDYLKIIYRNFKWKLPLKWIFYNWSLLWNTNKAVNHFNKYLKNNKINTLEKTLSLNIPMAQRQTNK